MLLVSNRYNGAGAEMNVNEDTTKYLTTLKTVSTV